MQYIILNAALELLPELFTEHIIKRAEQIKGVTVGKQETIKLGSCRKARAA